MNWKKKQKIEKKEEPVFGKHSASDQTFPEAFITLDIGYWFAKVSQSSFYLSQFDVLWNTIASFCDIFKNISYSQKKIKVSA